MHAVDLVVPGDIDTLTGGYIYDRRILAGLAHLGWETSVHSLPDSFPEPSADALAVAAAVLAGIRDKATVVIDGLALAGLKDLLPPHIMRLRLVALIHHPLAYETGLDQARAMRLEAAESAALARVHRVIVTSEWTKHVLESFGVGAERISVVEPGTDPAPLHRPHAGAPLELLCVASLTKRKGHAVLFDALARLRGRPWHLTCAGSLTRDRELVATLRGQIDRLGIRDRVTFLGELAPDAGRVRHADGLRTATLDQHRTSLEPSITLARALAPEGDQVVYCGRPVHVSGWARRCRAAWSSTS